jgi:choline trimethylamine-lyase
MLQALDRERAVRDRVLTTLPTARVERLRQRYLGTKDKIVLDIIRTRTRVMEETIGEPKAMRQAKAFSASVREMSINIYPDEPFVGWLFCEPRGSHLPWGQALAIENELDTMGTRKVNPFLISEEDRKELREDILPYWKKHRGGGSTLPHWTAGYEKVLKIGLLGVKKQAEERIERLDLADPEDFKKLTFLQGVVMALESACEIGSRFAAKARELADTEKDTERKAELLKIAETCDQMPAHPTKTFYETIQSV